MAKPPPSAVRGPKPRNNIYTVLALASILALGLGVGLLWWSNIEMTGWEQNERAGGTNPLYMVLDPDREQK